MATTPTTPPQRLQDIKDAYSKLRTSTQIADFRKTLTPEELKDLEAWLASLPRAARVTPTKPQVDLTKDFTKWAEGRIGLTQNELIINYADTHHLTPEGLKSLKEELIKKEAEAQAPKPVTPPKESILQTEGGKAFTAWADERAKMSEDEIFALEAESQGLKLLTPEELAAIEPSEKYTFANWVESRKNMTEDEIFALEAESQGLKLLTPEELAAIDPKTKTTFANWADERAKMTEDEIFALEAESQGLKELTPEEMKTLEERDRAEAGAAEEITKPKVPPQEQPTVKPELIIERTPYPKWWKDAQVKAISLSGPGTQTIVYGRPGYRTYVASITFTVSDETNISFSFGMFGSSGSMDFGGTDEPRAITINMADSPAPCGQGNFSITSNGSGVSVGGFAVYYTEPEK